MCRTHRKFFSVGKCASLMRQHDPPSRFAPAPRLRPTQSAANLLGRSDERYLECPFFGSLRHGRHAEVNRKPVQRGRRTPRFGRARNGTGLVLDSSASVLTLLTSVDLPLLS